MITTGTMACMETSAFTDFLLIKLVVVMVAAFIYGFITG